MCDLIRIQAFGLGIALKSYSVFLTLAAVAVLVLGTVTAARRGLDWRRSLGCLLFLLAATFVGARLLHRALRPDEYLEDPALLFTLNRIGLFLYGGLILSAVTAPLVCRLLRVDIWKLADAVAPAMGLGIALARVGCFLNGCCFGAPTRMPWGISLPSGSRSYFSQFAAGQIWLLDAPLPVHPAQLYEAAAALAGAVLAIWILRRKVSDGIAFLGFVFLFSTFRLTKLPFMPETMPVDRWFEPLLYSSVIAVCGGVALWRYRTARAGAEESRLWESEVRELKRRIRS